MLKLITSKDGRRETLGVDVSIPDQYADKVEKELQHTNTKWKCVLVPEHPQWTTKV